MRHIMCMYIPNDFHEVPDQEACGHFSMRLPTSPEPFCSSAMQR